MRTLVKDLLQFLDASKNKIDPLILAGLFHKQMVIIHPYQIIEFIKQKGFISDRDNAALVDRAKPTRRLDFNKLIELGLIAREGKGKNTYYILKEK